MQPSRVECEVRKLYAAFSGSISTHTKENTEGPCVVEASAWGMWTIRGQYSSQDCLFDDCSGDDGSRVAPEAT